MNLLIMPKETLKVNLPVPPSHNQLHKWIAGRVHRSPKYREWMRAVRDPIRDAIAELSPKARERLNAGRTAVYVTAALKGNRDLDNVLKPVIDALEEHRVYANDRRIHRIVADRTELEPGQPSTVTVIVDTTDPF